MNFMAHLENGWCKNEDVIIRYPLNVTHVNLRSFSLHPCSCNTHQELKMRNDLMIQNLLMERNMLQPNEISRTKREMNGV